MLLCCLFSSLVLAAAVIIDCAGWETAKAYGERMVFLSSRSVLAQYDRNLWDDYGLLAFQGTSETVSETMKDYLKGMERKRTAGEIGAHLMFDVLPESIEINLAGGTLFNKELVKGQIIELMKIKTIAEEVGQLTGLSGAKDLISEKRKEAENGLKAEEDQKNAAEDSDDPSTEVPTRDSVTFEKNASFEPEGSPKGERVLRSSRIKKGLPSYGYTKNFTLPKIDMKSEEEIMALGEKTTQFMDLLSDTACDVWEHYLLNRYILMYMNCALTEGTKETFFQNEIEYILNGSFSDDENYKALQVQLFLLRTGLNLAHIYGDSEKRTLTIEAAAAICGPFAAGPVQFLISVSWASFEAKNDLDVLKEGGKIPLFKKSEDWALSLDALMGKPMAAEAVRGLKEAEATGSGAANSQGSGSGWDYKGYLNIFLSLRGEDEKLLRVMDIITINMRGRHQEAFDLRTCVSRFEANVAMQRKQYTLRPGIALLTGDRFEVLAVHSYD